MGGKKTGAHLRVQSFGTNVLGVRLLGDKRQPEPEEFRVAFPGGSISVTRTTDGDYWAHVVVNHPGATFHDPDSPSGSIADGRVDVLGKHASESSAGDLGNPQAYHAAIRIEVDA